jgi:hypothetical protein
VNRLPVVRFKEMEKVLLALGFQIVRQRGATYSIDTHTAELPRFQTTQEETWPVRW